MQLYCVIILIFFSITVKCVSVDIDKFCADPPEITNAAPGDSNQRGPLYSVGTTLYYKCERGHGLVGDPRLHCVHSRGVAVWSTVKFSCVPSICGQPEKPDNGQIVGTEYSLGMVITYECNLGYVMWSHDGEQELMVPPVRMCLMDGKWNGEVPQCKPLTCPEPNFIHYGNIVKTSLDYMTRIRYSCFHGYELVGEESRWCSSSGEWSGKDPVCAKIITSEPPVITNREEERPSSNNRSENSDGIGTRIWKWIKSKFTSIFRG